MARAARNSALETRTARARLRIRRTPYFAKIAKGLRLGYYRGAIAGSWVVRCYRGAGVYATQALGIADDTLEADGIKVLKKARRRCEGPSMCSTPGSCRTSAPSRSKN